MQVSIKDIARAAGVSHSTVSRALSNYPLVAEKTRRRIKLIARELGYAPNAIARGLVTQQTRVIGVIVTSIADPFVAEVVRGIEETAADNHYRVFLGTSHADPTREVNLVKALHEWRVDGVIVASSRVGALYLPLLKKFSVPIVLVNNQQKGRYVHSVAVDDVQGGRLATQHLISLGHRTIGYITGPSYNNSSNQRCEGYRLALRQAEIQYDPSLVISGNGRVEGGANAEKFYSQSPKPTAIFCYNDMTAIGALQTLKSIGIRVPEDVSVIGYDDIPFAPYVDPPLTTIRQPMDEMGRSAMRMLIDLLHGEKIKNVIMPGELVARESTRASNL